MGYKASYNIRIFGYSWGYLPIKITSFSMFFFWILHLKPPDPHLMLSLRSNDHTTRKTGVTGDTCGAKFSASTLEPARTMVDFPMAEEFHENIQRNIFPLIMDDLPIKSHDINDSPKRQCSSICFNGYRP